MKRTFLAKSSLVALVAAAAFGLCGCGKEMVSFNQYSGNYDGKSYSVAATKWERQEDEEGIDGVYKLVGNVKYDDNTGKVLCYGSKDTKHFIAITFRHDKDVEVSEPTYFIDSKKLQPFDNGNTQSFTIIKSISAETDDFTVTINWNKDSSVKYKFVIDENAFTLENAPSVD